MDYWYRLMDIYIRWSSSVHDVRILTNSDLFAKGEEGTLLPDLRRMIIGCNVVLLIWVITTIHYFPGPISIKMFTSLVNEGLL